MFAAPVETPITATFDRVPWQQVFDSLLSSTGHTWTTSNGVIIVTSLENADLISPGASGRHVEVFDLDFASAVDVGSLIVTATGPFAIPLSSKWVTNLEAAADFIRVKATLAGTTPSLTYGGFLVPA